MNGRRPSPVECLALLAPTPEEIDLLRACLWDGPAAHAAWTRWQRAVGDPLAAIQRDVSGVKSFLPLLHYGLRGCGADAATSPLRHALAAAYASELLRWQAYAGVSARAFAALASAAVPFLAPKGGALAVSAYPEPGLRHSHDIDVLTERDAVDRATAALRAAGFVALPNPHAAARSVRLVSEEDVPIELHTSLYRLPYYGTSSRGIWDRATICEVAGVRVHTPSAADHLVYVCGQAACCASRDALKWIADAWFLARNPELEWPIVLQTTEESRLALPLAIMLRALADLFAAPVPASVLERLSATAAAADRPAQEIALTGLRAGRRGRLRDLLRASTTWRARLKLVRWLVVPSPAALRLGEPLHYPRAWPAYYLIRPSRYAARRLRVREWFSSRA